MRKTATTTPITGLQESWQQQARSSFKDTASLLDYLQIPAHQQNDVLEQSNFPIKVTKHYASLIAKGTVTDPLLLQVLSQKAEQRLVPGYHHNPVGDQEATASQGLLHKYHSRALLIATGTCPIHCRYCFRREFDYQENALSSDAIENIQNYLAQHDEIEELILSGGDPLMLSNGKLETLLNQVLNTQISTLRIHTRIPTTLPDRIDQELLALFSTLKQKIVLVCHINHPGEICLQTRKKMAALKSIGVTLLNQSVLLKGVNDNAETLEQLSRALFSADILPYYLHLLDKVNGAAHFNVDDDQANTLYKSLQGRLPGYLVPKLVREISGEAEKTLITPH